MSTSTWEQISEWKEIGAIAASQTTPAATARDAATVEALSNKILYIVPNGASGLEFRFRSNADNNDTIILDFLMARDDPREAVAGHDHYNRVATATLTVGQQTADTGYAFVDTVVVSNEYFNQEIKAVSPTGDYVGRLLVNPCGYNRLVIVATTLTTAKTVDVDVAVRWNPNVMLKA